MNWKYKNIEFNEAPNGYVGFIYMIKFEDGKRYIGKKNFFSLRKRNFGKKELKLITDKRLKKYEMVSKESNWKDYCSSNTEVASKIKNGDRYVKDILSFGTCSKHLTFLEEQYLYFHRVLYNENYLNDNISGRFFTKDISEWEYKRK